MIYLLIPALIFVIFIFYPLRISFNFNNEKYIQIRLGIKILLGIFNIKFFMEKNINFIKFSVAGGTLFKYNIKKPDKSKKDIKAVDLKESVKENEKKKKKIKIKKIFMLSKKYMNPGIKFLRRILGSVSWDRLSVRGIYGIEDPYYNGLIYGTVSAISSVYSGRIKVNLKPVFSENVFNGNASMSISIYLYRIIAAVFLLMTSVLWTKIRG